MGVSADYDGNSGRLGFEVKIAAAVEHVNQQRAELDGLCRGQERTGPVGVDVAADCRYGRYSTECIENGRIAYIAGVQYMVCTREQGQKFGP